MVHRKILSTLIAGLMLLAMGKAAYAKPSDPLLDTFDSVSTDGASTTYEFSISIDKNGQFDYVYYQFTGASQFPSFSKGMSDISYNITCTSGCGAGSLTLKLWDGSNLTTLADDGVFTLTSTPTELRVYGSGLGGGSTGYSGSLTVSPVPEPGELALMLSGLGLMGYMARRRARRQA
jgi:hypothetical protein